MTYFKVKTNPQTVFAISSDVEHDGELKGDLEERLDEMVKTYYEPCTVKNMQI